MIRQWGDAPEWATHIVAPVGSPDSEMWAQLIDGSYFSNAHRITRAKTMDEAFSLGIVIVSARDSGQVEAARIAPPKTVDLSDTRRHGRPPKLDTPPKPVQPPKSLPAIKQEPGKRGRPAKAPAPIPMFEGEDVEVSKMGGVLLSWAVSLALRLEPERLPDGKIVCKFPWLGEKAKRPIPDFTYQFGRGWLFVGQHCINLNAPHRPNEKWVAWVGEGRNIAQEGNTPLEAVCRCVVVLLIGQRVRVPTELLELTV